MKKILFGVDKHSHVEVFTKYKFLYDIEETRPKPASQFIPKWWKNMPRTETLINGKKTGTAKTCPSFSQMFSQGIVIPMWTDVIFKRTKDGFTWETPESTFTWEFHHNEQFISYLNLPKYQTVFKAISPWHIKTNKNVSVYQFPMFFHFNQDYTILPGIINTDYHWTINQQMIYTSDKDEFMIKRGDPFAWYLPFKRDKFNFEVSVADEKKQKQMDDNHMSVFTKFSGHYALEAKKRNI